MKMEWGGFLVVDVDVIWKLKFMIIWSWECFLVVEVGYR